jgi:hypothetical protein
LVRDEEEVDDGQEEQVDEESGVLQMILKTVFSVIGDASAEYVSIDLVPEIVPQKLPPLKSFLFNLAGEWKFAQIHQLKT